VTFKESARQVGDISVDAGRASTQIGWYRFAARQVTAGRTVIDIGCGLGTGLKELQATALKAVGQDLDPRLEREDIVISPIEDIPSKSYDVVVSVDVVEHVPEDSGFLRQLARIAKQAVFLTTPLSVLGREIWPYHIREYKAREFMALVAPVGRVTYYKGTPSGSEIYEVRNMQYFWMIDSLINSPLFNLPFRAGQKILPKRLRYNAHQAALIELT